MWFFLLSFFVSLFFDTLFFDSLFVDFLFFDYLFFLSLILCSLILRLLVLWIFILFSLILLFFVLEFLDFLFLDSFIFFLSFILWFFVFWYYYALILWFVFLWFLVLWFFYSFFLDSLILCSWILSSVFLCSLILWFFVLWFFYYLFFDYFILWFIPGVILSSQFWVLKCFEYSSNDLISPTPSFGSFFPKPHENENYKNRYNYLTMIYFSCDHCEVGFFPPCRDLIDGLSIPPVIAILYHSLSKTIWQIRAFQFPKSNCEEKLPKSGVMLLCIRGIDDGGKSFRAFYIELVLRDIWRTCAVNWALDRKNVEGTRVDDDRVLSFNETSQKSRDRR